MSDNFSACLAIVLREEGGFSNDNLDPGGITNLGVTLRTWQAWVGHPVDINDMEALTPAVVAPLYQRNFWNADSCAALPAGLDLCVLDFAVNAGPGHSARTLQSMVGATPDGAIGPATLAAVSSHVAQHGLGAAINEFQAARLQYYQSLGDWSTFSKGWTNRINTISAAAHNMAGS